MGKFLLVFAAVLFASSAKADVDFYASATPGFLAIEGKGGKIDGSFVAKEGMVSGKVKLKLAGFKTGSDLRDEHMCNYLKCKEHPEAVFELVPFPLKDGSVKIKGNLTLAGKTKEVDALAKVNGKNLEVDGTIKLSDFGIETPSYKLLTVAQEVDIHVLTSVK